MSGISLSRTTVLTVVLLIEVAVIGFFVARWYSRRWGWKSTFGRIRRYVRATFADLIRPSIALYRFGRNVRLIAAQLNDPELGGVLRSTTGEAAARLAKEPDTRPFATLISRSTVTLALSGLRRVEPEPPWRSEQGWWKAPRVAVSPGLTAQIEDVPIGPVVIGAENGTVTLLDLLRAPGVIEVTGPNRQVGSLICGVAAQLASGLTAFEEMDVIVASGLHPRFTGPKPLDVLRDLDAQARSANYRHRFTVLLCGPLNDAESDLLTAIVPRLPMLRVMLAGPYAGRRWQLPLTETGRIEAPELGLFTDSSPVERGVARALKLRARGVVPARPVVQPETPAPGTRRAARQGISAPPPAAAPPPSFFEEPEDDPYEYQPAQPQYQSGYANNYPDDAYAPPPGQPVDSGDWEEPAKPAPSPWDLDEPEPSSPPTGGHSVSAISARQAATRKPADSDRH